MKPLNERTKLSRYTATGRDLTPLKDMPLLPKRRALAWVRKKFSIFPLGASGILNGGCARMIAKDGGALVRLDVAGNYIGCGMLSDDPEPRPWLVMDTSALLNMPPLFMAEDDDDPFSKGSFGEYISDTFGVSTYEAVCDLFWKARYLKHIHRDEENGAWVGGPLLKSDIPPPKRLGGRPVMDFPNISKTIESHGGVVTRANEAALAEAAGCSIRTLWRAWKKLKETTNTK